MSVNPRHTFVPVVSPVHTLSAGAFVRMLEPFIASFHFLGLSHDTLV